MWVQLAWAVGSMVVSLAVGYFLRKKADGGLDPTEVEAPVAEEGGTIPVLFGTRDIEAMVILWYGDIKVEAIRKKGGKK